MFGKLLKHDLKATGRVIPIVMAASLLMVLLSFAFCQLGQELIFLQVLLILLIFACFFAVLILTYIFLILHFYKSSYGTTSYLTRTLPVSQKKVYYSKFLTGIIWSFMSYAICALLLLSLLALIASMAGGGVTLGMILSELWSVLFPTSSLWPWILIAFYLLLMLFQPVILYQFCCCAGNLRPFRRIGRAAPLLVYAIYYVANQVLSFLSFFIPLQLGLNEKGALILVTDTYFKTVWNANHAFTFPLFPMVIALVFTVAGFFLCRRWYAKSINLR